MGEDRGDERAGEVPADAGTAAAPRANGLPLWIGVGVGAGIGSAAVAAALLYANRARRPASRPRGPRDEG